MYLNFFKKVGKEARQIGISRSSAALAFYTIYILAPMAVVFVSIAGLIIGPDLAGVQLVGYFQSRTGGEVVPLIEQFVSRPLQAQTSLFFSLVGILIMLYGFSRFFSTLKETFFSIFNVGLSSSEKLGKLFSDHLKSLSFSLYLAVLIFILIFANTITPILSGFFSSFIRGDIPFLEFFLSFLLTTSVLFSTYRIVSLNNLSWREAMVGALFAAFLFSLLNIVLSLYFNLFQSVNLVYGASSSIVAFLLWVYYSVRILLLGALVSSVFRDLKSNGLTREK